MDKKSFMQNSKIESEQFRGFCESKNKWLGEWVNDYYKAYNKAKAHENRTGHDVDVKFRIIRSSKI